jgi:TPR repeat protein
MLFATPVVAGDYEDAWAAYKAGDHQKAFRLLKPLAEQGHAEAQADLSWWYLKGYIVPRSKVKALYWQLMAAERGHQLSQFHMGLECSGRQRQTYTTEELAQCYAWTSIVVARNPAGEFPPAQVNLELIENDMNADQISRGKKLAAEYWEKYIVPFQKN